MFLLCLFLFPVLGSAVNSQEGRWGAVDLSELAGGPCATHVEMEGLQTV